MQGVCSWGLAMELVLSSAQINKSVQDRGAMHK